MAEQTQEKPKGSLPAIFGSVGKLFKSGLRSAGMVLAVIAVLMILCINLWMAYIMFAPDSMPKPFYLAYQGQQGSQTNQQPAEQPAAQPADEHAQPAQKVPSVEHKAPSVPLEIKAGQGIMFDSGSKIVNLADPSGRRYVKTTIILEYAPNDITYFLEAQAEPAAESGGGGHGGEAAATTLSYSDKFKQELEPLRPLIDDTIITLLSSKTFEQVYTAAGKEQLRKEMVNLLNSRMPEYRVIFVYFTEFTVQ